MHVPTPRRREISWRERDDKPLNGSFDSSAIYYSLEGTRACTRGVVREELLEHESGNAPEGVRVVCLGAPSHDAGCPLHRWLPSAALSPGFLLPGAVGLSLPTLRWPSSEFACGGCAMLESFTLTSQEDIPKVGSKRRRAEEQQKVQSIVWRQR